jgi:hypothetical protein
MDPFTLFASATYTFLEISQQAEGNTIADEYEAEGIFKLRDGLGQTDAMENYSNGDATLHIKPDEDFLVIGELTGHGVRVDGIEYRIKIVTEGRDYDNGRLMFYRLTLKREDTAQWPAGSQPLE